MKRLTVFLAACAFMAAAAVSANEPERDLMQDTWVATDALGREMPSSDTIPVKNDKERTVGIFYITWHGEALHNASRDYRNVTETLEADPQARLSDHDGLWSAHNACGSYHWGEPEMGYFLSCDEWVMRKDMSMLADAGVDVIILDVTNGVCYWEEWGHLFDVMERMKAEGNRVPKICFWTFNGRPITCTQQVYERYYKKGLYKDLWYYWDGKPLMLCNMRPELDANGSGENNPNPNYDPAAATDPSHPHYGDPEYAEKYYADYTNDVKRFFTMRNMWWGYNDWGGKPYAGTEDNWCFGYEMNDTRVSDRAPRDRAATHLGRVEEMAVTAGQHPISVTGKSWRVATGQPTLNVYDMPDSAYVPWLGRTVADPSAYGIYFQDRWDEALSVDPDFIYLNDWNEWTAGKYRIGLTPDGKPNGPDAFLGRKNNTFYFVDQYNAEFNRTIQPVKGQYTDNYYMQMVQNIRRYKGVRPIPEHSGVQTVRIDGRFGDWAAIPSYYFDPIGDTAHRDHNGYAGHHYVDTLGRNDIVEAKVAVGKKDMAFYVRTDSALTACTDPDWMLLLIDADRDYSTGWHGYDYIVNKRVKSDRATTLMRYDSEAGEWIEVATVPYAVSDREMELSIPRKLLNLTGNSVTFDFKWVDNPQDFVDPISLCTAGDTAPNRRFNYRYKWHK